MTRYRPDVDSKFGNSSADSADNSGSNPGSHSGPAQKNKHNSTYPLADAVRSREMYKLSFGRERPPQPGEEIPKNPLIPQKWRAPLLAGILGITAIAAMASLGKGRQSSPVPAQDAGLAAALASDAADDAEESTDAGREIDFDETPSDSSKKTEPAKPASPETSQFPGNFKVRAGSGIGKQIFDAALSLATTVEQRTRILDLERNFENGATKDIAWSLQNPAGQDDGKMAYYRRLLKGATPSASVEATDPELVLYQQVESDFATNSVANIHNIQAGKQLNGVRIIAQLSGIVGQDINSAHFTPHTVAAHTSAPTSAVHGVRSQVDFGTLDQAHARAHAKPAPKPFEPIIQNHFSLNLPTTVEPIRAKLHGLDSLRTDHVPTIPPVASSAPAASSTPRTAPTSVPRPAPKVIRNAPMPEPSREPAAPPAAPKPTGRFERLMHDGHIMLPSHWDVEKAFEPEFFTEVRELVENCGIMGCTTDDEQDTFSKFVRSLSAKDFEILGGQDDQGRMFAKLSGPTVARLKSNMESAKILAELDWDAEPAVTAKQPEKAPESHEMTIEEIDANWG